MSARATAAIAAAAISSAIFWKWVSGGAVDAYVGNIFGRSWVDFYGFLSGSTAGRTLFVSESGEAQPVAYRVVAILGVLLTSAGLAVGFFRSLALPSVAASSARAGRREPFLGMRDNAWAIVLTLSSFLYPPSIVLRLTSGGWELGNRMSAFVFLGVSLVVAVGAAKALITPHAGRLRIVIVGLCLALMVAGGVIAERPPDLVAGRYRPAADGPSIEPMGIATAQLTRDWLGEDQRFASDRVNRLLLATYGVQRIVTYETDGAEPGQVLFDEVLSGDDMDIIRAAKPNFLLADLRLQGGRPLLGFYFDSGEERSLHKSAPLGVDLEKFDNVPNVGRIFDNGYEVIYDIRNLLEAAPLNPLHKEGSPENDLRIINDVVRVNTLPAPNNYVARTERVPNDAASADTVWMNTARVDRSPNDTARIDRSSSFGRTFRRGGLVSYDAALMGPPAPLDGPPPNGAQASWLYSNAKQAPLTYSGEAVGRRIGDRTKYNYDAGVLRHVAK
jgi:hypothetical protein